MNAPVCLGCGEALVTTDERRLLVCDDCQYDTREDDHSFHIPNLETRAVDG